MLFSPYPKPGRRKFGASLPHIGQRDPVLGGDRQNSGWDKTHLARVKSPKFKNLTGHQSHSDRSKSKGSKISASGGAIMRTISVGHWRGYGVGHSLGLSPLESRNLSPTGLAPSCLMKSGTSMLG
jgi:hypothetical protein